MTDTFANGPGAPGGATPDPSQQAGDVTGTLAELERKLRELESELSAIGQRRVLAGATPTSYTRDQQATGDVEEHASRASPAGGRLIDEAIEPPQAQPTPAEPAGVGQPVKFVRPTEPLRPSPSHAEAHQERLRPSEAQLASLAELRRFRDRLERFAGELAAEYDALLGRVMSGLTATTTAATTPESAAQTMASFTAPGEVAPGDIQPGMPAGGVASAAAPLATTPPSPEDALFEGRVELGVGPFYDIVSLSAFERRLASLPYVVEASVRRFEASHAVVDIRLAAPVALVRELRRTADSDFNVREVADGRILLTFDDA